MRSTTILLIAENEIQAARLLTLGIRYRVFWRQLDRQILPLVIVVDPSGNVTNCFIVIGILERLNISAAVCRCRHSLPLISGDRSLVLCATRNFPSDLFFVSV
jgi:hypothetical protein